MDDNDTALVRDAEQQAFQGWDFSFLRGRWREAPLSWDYHAIVRSHAAQASAMLDMGTGGGEVLASLQPLPAYTAATESYPPNIALAQAALAPLGVEVAAVTNEANLPFADETFDLIINRHESFVASEVWRLLRRGGMFITQQVGGRDAVELNEALEAAQPTYVDWSLEQAVGQLQDAGLALRRKQQESPTLDFFDIGAVVYYLKVIEWQIPGFTVAGYADQLRRIHETITKTGMFTAHSQRFLIEAIKP